MPPPKPKLHKTTGRLKNINSNSPESRNRENLATVNNRINPNTQSNPNIDNIRDENNPGESPAYEQFELELYWCIQTLENSLSSGKLNVKQAQDAERTLKVLKGSNQPMVKKRQLMQSTFGDYRKKMADEEKKLRVGNTSIQFIEGAKEQNASNKGHFVKKSFTSTLGSSTNFKFNFPINNAMEKLSIDKPVEIKYNNTQNVDKNTHELNGTRNRNDNQCFRKTSLTTAKHPLDISKSKFITSDNSFKFNFAVKDD